MPIVQEKGHWRSYRTLEEERLIMKGKIKASDDWEFKIAQHLLQQGARGEIENILGLAEQQWDSVPVPIEEWLTNSHYIGDVGDNLYHPVKQSLLEFFQVPCWESDWQEVVLTGGFGWGKSKSGNTIIYDSGIGRRRRIDEIGDFKTPAKDEGGLIKSFSCTAYKSGYKDCVDLVLVGGQRTTTSKDHEFFTDKGWVKSIDLTKDHLIATPRSIPDPENFSEYSDAEVKMVAYLAANGGCTGSSARFTNKMNAVMDEFLTLVEPCGGSGVSLAKTSSKVAFVAQMRGMIPFIRKHKLNCLSKVKRVPADFWGLPKKQLALFINRFWACDGSVYTKSPRKIEATLASEGLVDDLRFMLLRLGILCRKHKKKKRYTKKDGSKIKEFDAWQLSISDIPNIKKFLEVVGPVLSKEQECLDLAEAIKGKRTSTNWDVVPITQIEIDEIVAELRDQGCMGLRDWPRSSKGYLGYHRFKMLCEKYNYHGRHRWYADADLCWEPLLSRTEAGFQDVYDLSVPEVENFIADGIVVHNSVLSGLIILRILYELVCLKNPQATLGLMPGTKIYIMPIAHRVETARDVVFGEVVEKLRLIDFFRGRYKETLDEIRFKDKGIYIKGGASGDNAILGLTIFAAIIDESNFFGRKTNRGSAHEERGAGAPDRAEGIYEGLVKRIKSRFEGKGGAKGRAATGKLIMASSKRGTNDFTERRIKKAAKEGRIDVFIRDLATWDKDPEAFKDVPRFKVLARSEAGVSRVLEPDEIYVPIGNELVIDVPENWKRDFEENPDKALRDVAGIATEGFDPFIKRRVAIKMAMTRNFPQALSDDTWDSDGPLEIHWDRFMGRDENHRPVPLCCPNAERHVHLDMSGTECATGFVVGHKGPSVELARRDSKTQEITYETVPIVHVDVILKITVPKIGEIHHPSVRQLVKRLHDGGLRITTMTMDQWNYIANKQELEKWGFKVEQLSVTRKPDPYVCLKEGLYDHRIYMPWHEPLRVELYDLEKNEKGKIVAPSRSSVGTQAGSKDIADSMAGVVYYLTHMAAELGGGVVMPTRGISEEQNIFEGTRFSDPFGPVFSSEEDKGTELLARTRAQKRSKKKKGMGKGRGSSSGGSPVFAIT